MPASRCHSRWAPRRGSYCLGLRQMARSGECTWGVMLQGLRIQGAGAPQVQPWLPIHPLCGSTLTVGSRVVATRAQLGLGGGQACQEGSGRGACQRHWGAAGEHPLLQALTACALHCPSCSAQQQCQRPAASSPALSRSNAPAATAAAGRVDMVVPWKSSMAAGKQSREGFIGRSLQFLASCMPRT